MGCKIDETTDAFSPLKSNVFIRVYLLSLAVTGQWQSEQEFLYPWLTYSSLCLNNWEVTPLCINRSWTFIRGQGLLYMFFTLFLSYILIKLLSVTIQIFSVAKEIQDAESIFWMWQPIYRISLFVNELEIEYRLQTFQFKFVVLADSNYQHPSRIHWLPRDENYVTAV